MSETQKPGLLELQRRVAAAILHPLTRAETMPRRRRDGASNQREAEALIRPNDRLTSFERMEIYNRQYWFRLYSAFEEDFPGLKAVLGAAKFETLMRDYLTDCPSTSFTLRNLGSRLVEWLESHPGHMEPRRELAVDMARLEWAHIEAFDAAALDAPTPAEMAALDGESPLSMQPYLRALALHYPVDDLLIALRSENGSSDASSNNASAARRTRHVRRVAMLTPQKIYLALNRHENSVYYKRLEREEFRLLEALLAGRTLGAAIETALSGSSIPEEMHDTFLRQTFTLWSTLGWFARKS